MHGSHLAILPLRLAVSSREPVFESEGQDPGRWPGAQPRNTVRLFSGGSWSFSHLLQLPWQLVIVTSRIADGRPGSVRDTQRAQAGRCRNPAPTLSTLLPASAADLVRASSTRALTATTGGLGQ